MLRPRSIQKTSFVESHEEAGELAFRNRGAAEHERAGELAQGAPSVEQREHVGGTVRNDDWTDLRVGWIAQNERALAALVNREDLDRPQAWVLS